MCSGGLVQADFFSLRTLIYCFFSDLYLEDVRVRKNFRRTKKKKHLKNSKDKNADELFQKNVLRTNKCTFHFE